MGHIENEKDFRIFMELNGPKGYASRSNYLSWLNFIAESGFSIDSMLSDNATILDFLKASENKRSKYKSKAAYSDFGSALKKYREFLNMDFVSLLSDLEDVDQNQLSETEKRELRKARIGQGKYRRNLVALWGKCSVTQFSIREFLVASHILPWRNSSNYQRLDKYNGLLLLPTYDKLFDKGYISFDNSGNIITSSRLTEREYLQLGIKKTDKIFKIYKENIQYLEEHRSIFKDILEK